MPIPHNFLTFLQEALSRLRRLPRLPAYLTHDATATHWLIGIRVPADEAAIARVRAFAAQECAAYKPRSTVARLVIDETPLATLSKAEWDAHPPTAIYISTNDRSNRNLEDPANRSQRPLIRLAGQR